MMNSTEQFRLIYMYRLQNIPFFLGFYRNNEFFRNQLVFVGINFSLQLPITVMCREAYNFVLNSVGIKLLV